MNSEQISIETMVENLNIEPTKNTEEVADEYINWTRQPIVAKRIELTKQNRSLTLPAIARCFSLVFVDSGTVEVAVDNKFSVIAAGYGVGVTANTESRYTAIDETEAVIDVLIFNIASIFSYGNTFLSSKYAMPYLNIKERGFETFNCSHEVGADINKNMKIIMKYMYEQPYGYELIVKARICEIWYRIVSSFNAVMPVRGLNNPRKDEQRVKKALAYIENNYKEPITLDDIASELNICKSECCRCFKRILELSPIEAVVRYRIYKAAYILDSEDGMKTDIASVAISVGFNNISYFDKMFKKYIGITPTEYKKREVGVNKNDAGNKFVL